MDKVNLHFAGLNDKAVSDSRKQFGTNEISYKKEYWFLNAGKSLIKEPMILLLLLTAIIYFMLGNSGDGIFLCVAIFLVAAISLFQDNRSRNALKKLEIYTQPYCKVIRNNLLTEIRSADLVKGDYLVVEEGMLIAADGIIVQSNDFSVNESILTGESLAVYKNRANEDHIIYKGTTVESGLAIAKITAIGISTRIAKIGKSIENIKTEKTSLELQINRFVKKMALAGILVFFLVWILNYFRTYNILDSLIKALTMAMSILPEEIPVAFTTFMALGAWRLMKMGILVKQMKTVEALGSATVLCADKTGTLTENKMQLAKYYSFLSKETGSIGNVSSMEEKELLQVAFLACEPIPFDPMETEIHRVYNQTFPIAELPVYKMIHEYPLDGTPPMMTHIYTDETGNKIIASKGAPEALIHLSGLAPDEIEEIEFHVKSFANKGYRVLGVAVGNKLPDGFPKTQQEFHFNFKGLIAFYDPPKKNITAVLNDFEKAGIAFKIVTGDNLETTTAIAREIQFKSVEQSISGEAILHLNDADMQEKIKTTGIFYRTFPEAKLKIINGYKANKEIVAMTGDGVNDGPALKAAHIGIAMGKKGTEIAKKAASLILLEDDLSKMVDAVAMGRKIYANLKKAVRYIISIHIPIILTVFSPLALGWVYPNIFTPVHIIFLELIMGPTCSIIYENEPIEQNLMQQKPRQFQDSFFNWSELLTSIVQGLVITIGVLFVYRYAVQTGYTENQTRTMCFLTLITANIFLTLVNRSFHDAVFKTIRYKNNLVPIIIAITILITSALLFINPFAKFFLFEKISGVALSICIISGFCSVIWYEIVKLYNRKKSLL